MASRIFHFTREIQSDLARSITNGDLAVRADMSSSTFFEHFKSVTSWSYDRKLVTAGIGKAAYRGVA